jgi:hypothetical protein
MNTSVRFPAEYKFIVALVHAGGERRSERAAIAIGRVTKRQLFRSNFIRSLAF